MTPVHDAPIMSFGDKFCGSDLHEVTSEEMTRIMRERLSGERDAARMCEAAKDDPEDGKSQILVVGLPRRNVIAEYMERARAAEEANMPFIPVTESIPVTLRLDPSRAVFVSEAGLDEFSQRRHMQQAKSRARRKRK